MMSTITDRWSGEIPADLSDQASEQRRSARHTYCHAVEVPEAWSQSATLDEQLVRLSTIEGNDAEFVKSLADQYAKKGELSQKQLWYVGRLYRKYSDKNYWLRQALLGHNWQQVGFIVHHYNTVLGTFSATNYHKCSKCGLDGETTEFKNYSGD
jgi:hypothetical protein